MSHAGTQGSVRACGASQGGGVIRGNGVCNAQSWALRARFFFVIGALRDTFDSMPGAKMNIYTADRQR